MRLLESLAAFFDSIIDRACQGAIIRAAGDDDTFDIPYPEGDIVGPCICGSWPGGKCLRCPRITQSKP